MAQRGVGLRVHRWLSLALLAWILLESVTGAFLVFAPEIDRWWNRDQYNATPGDVGTDSAIDAARDARPGEPVRFVIAPGTEGSMYAVETVDEAGALHTVLVDPGTGDVTTSDLETPSLVRFAERLHFNLNSTSILGFAATTIVAWLSVAWLAILVTGFSVWYWPRIKRWARMLRVRRGRGSLVFNIDLHNAIGMAVIVPMAVVVLTGINFYFNEQVKDVYSFVTFGLYNEPDTTASLSEPGASEPISAGTAMEIVDDLDPAIDVQYVETPSGSPVGVYSVYAHVDPSYFAFLGGEHDVEFEVDQYSGQIVRIRDPLDENGVTQAYDTWSYPLHTGAFGGTITRWLWVLIGLAPFALGWTGVAVWWKRRRKRTASTPSPTDELVESPS